MIILIDNYDSFSYNLYQLIGSMNTDIKVIKNDEMTVQQIEELQPTHIIISPGPGRPKDAGICKEAIRYFSGKVPILGVCLGHQAICEEYGATVSYANKLMHGKKSIASVDTEDPIFRGLQDKIVVGRYHSLSVVPDTLPDELRVISRTEDNEIMAIRHRDFKLYGLQFHPESILTPGGGKMIENFLCE